MEVRDDYSVHDDWSPWKWKSTYAKSLGVPVVSSDAIREEILGDANRQDANNLVFNEVHKRIMNHLSNGESVCYDATNLSRSRRKKFLKTVPAEVVKVAVLVATDYEICLENNKNRDRFVPEDVIFRMYKSISLPRYDEGWDIIRYVQSQRNQMLLYRKLFETKDFNQDNPHYSLTLYEHMVKAFEHFRATKDNPDYDIPQDIRACLSDAIIFHDIGKPVCKTYETYSGKVDDHAHYYNHAEVGAYILACSLSMDNSHKKVDNELNMNFLNSYRTEREKNSNYVKIITFVQCHMMFFEQNSDESINNLCQWYGADFAKYLGILHEADLAAH